jgi:hypothetical protein
MRKGQTRVSKFIAGPYKALYFNNFRAEFEITQAVYQRTAQTAASFASGSQTYYLNIANLIANSNTFKEQCINSSSVPTYERYKITELQFTWYPNVLAISQGTFEPVAFAIRYYQNYSVDTVLPTGYQGNYNQSHLPCLLQQSNRPQSFALKLPDEYICNESNRPNVGQWISAFVFNNYASTLGGIITLTQSTPSLNTVGAYNPKLGELQIRVIMLCCNSIG